MEVEADIFLVFTGFNAATTAPMSVAELMRWHTIAIKRHNQGQESNHTGYPFGPGFLWGPQGL